MKLDVRSIAVATAAGLLVLASYAASPSPDAEPVAPAPKEAHSVATPVHVEPIAVALDDPPTLQSQLEELRRRQRDGVDAPVREPEADETDDEGRRVITIDVPRIENVGPVFRFRDATVREGGAERLPGLTIEQRRAAVEAYRRALVDGKTTKPKRRDDGER